jgi:hypothetical protein
MAGERAGAGARCVEENAVEWRAEGKRLGRIELHEIHAGEAETLELRLHRAETVGVAVCGDDESVAAGGAGERGSFSSRRGAEIEDAVARVNVEQEGDGLGGFVLDGNFSGAEGSGARGAAAACGEGSLQETSWLDAQAGFFELADDCVALGWIMDGAGEARSAIVRFEQGESGRLAEADEPPFDHPSRVGVRDAEAFGGREVRRQEFFNGRFRFRGGAAQNGVDEGGGGGFAGALDQFDGFVDGSARGNLFKKAQLVEAQAQSERDGEIEAFDGFLELALEKKIEEAAPAQDAQGELGGERGVGGLDVGAELGVEEVAGVGAFGFDAAQYVVSDLPGSADWHGEPSKHKTARKRKLENGKLNMGTWRPFAKDQGEGGAGSNEHEYLLREKLRKGRRFAPIIYVGAEAPTP